MNKKEPDEIQASEGIQSDLTDFERLEKKKNRRSKKILGAVFVICVLFLAVYFNGVKKKVESVIGPASPALSRFQQFRLIIQLEPELSRLTEPASDKIDQTLLSVRSGETPAEIARELKEKQVLSDEDLFLRYLIYSGEDRQLKPGRYIIPAGSNIPEIGKVLTDTGNSLVEFSILNGMRLEEIAALLPSSGLSISPEDF
ncbi:MAG TPA: endolytic transglycosylase MltG, partial [Flexilinea sp.]|nr:endolytic transglycosylase MltG [Flexilinea sp.]